MFKQKIENGYQVEVPDNWLKDGNPFELRRRNMRSRKIRWLCPWVMRSTRRINSFRKATSRYVRSRMIFGARLNNNIVNTLRVGMQRRSMISS